MTFPLFGSGGGGGDDDVDVYDGDDDGYYGTEMVSYRIRVKLYQTSMQRRLLTVNASCRCHD